jgi:hypothetical protein
MHALESNNSNRTNSSTLLASQLLSSVIFEANVIGFSLFSLYFLSKAMYNFYGPFCFLPQV